MKISIITVAYNSGKTIRETIQSVALQSYPDVEYIIVDGNSSDDTLEIIKSFGNVVSRVISEPDGGIYYAMNKGLSAATGEVIGFLNSDDFFINAGVLSVVAKEMSDLTLDACYGDLIYVSSDNTNKIVRYWKSRPYKHGLCSSGWMPAHPTFYVRRAIYVRYGFFDTRFKLQADYEMALRLLDINGVNARYIPKILVRMRVGGASNSSLLNIIKGNLEALKACHKHGLRAGIGFLLKKISSRIPQFFWRP